VKPLGAVSLTGETIVGVEIPLVATSHGPKAIALANKARAVLIFGAKTQALKLFG